MSLENKELTPSEMLVFEKYFNGDECIPLEKLYFYFQMLRQTKDFYDSKHTVSEEDSTKFEMVFMTLHQVGENITFNGAVSNGIENRCVDGVIKQKGKRYYVLTHVYRLNQSIPENIKEYYVYDTFKKIKDKLYQETIYDESLSYRQVHGEGVAYKAQIPEFDMESFEEFKKQVGSTYSV